MKRKGPGGNPTIFEDHESLSPSELRFARVPKKPLGPEILAALQTLLIPTTIAPTIPTPAEWAVTLGFIPDPVQARVLNSTASRLILLTTRQWGKSSVAAIRALWQAIFFTGSLILVVAPTQKQAAELTHKIYQFVERLGLQATGGGAGQLALHLPNNSRIIGLPDMPQNIRGYSAPDLILVDEAAFFHGDEILESLMPMLATRPDACIWLMSTPHSQSGFFYDAWRHPETAWTRISVTAAEIPNRISPEFLAAEQLRNPTKYLREYCCQFIALDDGLFNRDDLVDLLTDEVQSL